MLISIELRPPRLIKVCTTFVHVWTVLAVLSKHCRVVTKFHAVHFHSSLWQKRKCNWNTHNMNEEKKKLLYGWIYWSACVACWQMMTAVRRLWQACYASRCYSGETERSRRQHGGNTTVVTEIPACGLLPLPPIPIASKRTKFIFLCLKDWATFRQKKDRAITGEIALLHKIFYATFSKWLRRRTEIATGLVNTWN